jgi:hypothetical protein
MRRINEVQRNIGRANVPELHEVVEVGSIADEESGVIPSWPDGIVPSYQVSREKPDAHMVVDVGSDRRVLVDIEIDRNRCLREDVQIVDADLSWVGVRAVLHKKRIGQGVVRCPHGDSHALLVYILPSRCVLALHEHIVNIKQVRSCRPILFAQKQLSRNEWRDEMRKLLRKTADHGRIANGPHDIGAEHIDDVLRLVWAVSHYDGIESAAPQGVGQPNRFAEGLTVFRVDRPSDPQRPVADIDTCRVHDLASHEGLCGRH